MSARNLLLAFLGIAALSLVAWVASEKAVPVSAPPASTDAEPPPRASVPEPDRSERAVVERSPETSGVEPAVVFTVSGHVVDVAGKPVGNLRIGVLEENGEPAASTRSAADGSFDLQPFALPCRIAVQEPKWTTVAPAVVEAGASGRDIVLVVAPATALSGRVTDRAGRALPGALLEIRMDPAAVASSSTVWTAASGNEGRFLFDAAPSLTRLEMRTSLPGWRTDLRPLDLPPQAELTIVLDPEEPAGPELEGSVVHADGSPASGALVSLGSARTRTDAQGNYRFFCGWFEARTPLVAVARSLEPAVLESYGARIDRTSRSVPRERLVLPGPALAIAGRVLSPRGEPCKGWRVVLEGGTPLDPGGFSRDLAEELAASRSESRTDSNGAFRIEGLRARSYTVLAVGRGRGTRRLELAVRSKPVAAGTGGLELSAPDYAPGEAIRGRVIDDSGAPVASARLGLSRTFTAGGSPLHGRMEAMSAADGSFAIEGTPSSLVHLLAIAPSGFPAGLELEPGASRTALELRVQRSRELTFDGSRAFPRPDALQAVRADGTPARILGPDATLVRLVDGACGPIPVAADAREIVLYRGCLELARLALPASSGDVSLSWP